MCVCLVKDVCVRVCVSDDADAGGNWWDEEVGSGAIYTQLNQVKFGSLC